MTNKLSSRVRRKCDSSFGRHLCIECLEPRRYLDASADLSLPLQPYEGSSSQSVPSSSNQLMEFRIQLSDMQGKSIESVRVGDEFWIKVYVRDLRNLPPNSLHLFSAYTELFLDPNLFVTTGNGKLGDDFWEYKGELQLREAQSALRNNPSSLIGGLVTAPYPEGDGHLLFEVPVRSIAEGEGTIATKPIQSVAANFYSSAFYGNNSPVREDSIRFGSLPITVLPVASPTTTIPQPILSVSQPSQTRPSSDPRILDTPVTTTPSAPKNQLDTQIVSARPEPKQQLTSAIPMVPLKVNSQNEISDQAELQRELPKQLGSDVKTPLLVSIEESVFEEGLMRTLVELAASHLALFDEAIDFSAFHAISFISFTPLQKRQSDSSQLLSGGSKLASLTITNRFECRKYLEQQWIARDVIDKMLERLETNTSMHDQLERFEWDTTYSRLEMRRLPLYVPHYDAEQYDSRAYDMSQYDYEPGLVARDAFAEVANRIALEKSAELRHEETELLGRVDLASTDRTQDLDAAFKRSSMKVIPLFSETSDSEIHDDLKSEEPSDLTVATYESENTSDTPQKVQSAWATYLAAGLTSFFVILRGRIREFHKGPPESGTRERRHARRVETKSS